MKAIMAALVKFLRGLAKRSLSRPFDSAIMLSWVLVATVTVIGTIAIMYCGAISAPYWDQWQYTDPDHYLAHLFDKHNEHPLILGRLLFALDYELFNARGWALQATTFFVQAVEVASFVALAWFAGFRSHFAVIMWGAFATAITFNPESWENLVWGFQPPFVTAFAAAVASVACLAVYAEDYDGRWMVAGFVAGFVSVISLSNGVFVPMMLVFMAWRIGARWSAIAPFVLLSVLAWALFFLMPGGTSTLPGLSPSNFPAILIYVFRYLGSAVGNTLMYWGSAGGPKLDTMTVSLVAGALLVVAGVATAAPVLLARKPNAGALALALLVAFAGVTAGVTALGRVSFPSDQAISSRYGTCAAMLIVAVAILIARWAAPRLTQHRARAVLAVGVVVALLIPLCTPQLARNLTGLARGRRDGQTALVTGVPDAKSIGNISFNMSYSIAASQGLKEREKWMFEDRWSRSVGTAINVGAVQNQVCAGTFILRDTETVNEGFFRVGGLVDRKAASAAKLVVVVDSTNQMVGYGLVPRRVSDIVPVTGSGATQLDWQGHALDTRRPPYTAYLASAKALHCHIGAHLTPSAARQDGNLTARSPRTTKYTSGAFNGRDR